MSIVHDFFSSFCTRPREKIFYGKNTPLVTTNTKTMWKNINLAHVKYI